MLAFIVNLAQEILSNHICCIWFYNYILESNIVNASVEDGVFIVVTNNLPIYIKRTSNHLCKIFTLHMRKNNFSINQCVSDWIWSKWCLFFIRFISSGIGPGLSYSSHRSWRFIVWSIARTVNESPWLNLICASKASCFEIVTSLLNSSGCSRRKDIWGTTCPLNFNIYCIFLLPSSFTGPR